MTGGFEGFISAFEGDIESIEREVITVAARIAEFILFLEIPIDQY
jgi:hypothetical protein